MSGFIVGAYAAAPGELDLDPRAEDEWYRHLRDIPGVGGLELAWAGTLHPRGVERLAEVLDPAWGSVVTCIPGTGRTLATDPVFGLASDNTDGRHRAVDDLARVHAEVRRLQHERGDAAVLAVEIHSAPHSFEVRSSPESFAASLSEVAAWPWGSARLMVEHCDAVVPAVSGRARLRAQKGFLSLADEIAAVAAANAAISAMQASTQTAAPASATSALRPAIGHALNWARSAIETRSVDGPAAHLAAMVSAGTPTAVMFSGVSPVETEYGEAFLDAHLPVAAPANGWAGAAGHGPVGAAENDRRSGLEPTSLLTGDIVQSTLALAGPTGFAYVGVKVGASRTRLTHLDRLAPTLATLAALEHAALTG
ncbi:DUF4862 family protein [Subtercola vilae]|uniref:DUF4862 family protein n=1 Tax=Subtercola vilae TaxID=2056433 RepID=A0A4T2C847_9MICO|nr:DUF4862 family protein [Subtercola vilae]TIH40069.1 DUF4862 family protein [Subtercola vilae]